MDLDECIIILKSYFKTLGLKLLFCDINICNKVRCKLTTADNQSGKFTQINLAIVRQDLIGSHDKSDYQALKREFFLTARGSEIKLSFECRSSLPVSLSVEFRCSPCAAGAYSGCSAFLPQFKGMLMAVLCRSG